MHKIIFVFFLMATSLANSQIVGTITNSNNEPLPYVNIYLQENYKGTTSNQLGHYSLPLSEKKEYNIVYQFLGYKKIVKKITPTSFPFMLDIQLEETEVSLEEVLITKTEDPAYAIIRNTISRRKSRLEKISQFEADFYSRGIWRVKDVPEKILGQEVGDLDGALDSTRTGIIYLSETISQIAYKKPDDFKEKIIASKVSGDDNGFSFNSAQDANFSFYENTVDLNAAIVSPIANNAFGYYRYKLLGIFYEGSKLINKIEVTPKRKNDRVWSGTIYIVEDDWQLYGVELTTNGAAIQVPFIKELVFKQNFKFDETNEAWIKISQTIDFGFGMLGFNGNGRFIAVYSNYNFSPVFSEKSFTNEVLSFEEAANKKDSLFWSGKRPVPLTEEEVSDYVRKDSIQTLRKSQVYLDSIDRKNNKPKLLSPLTGYTYRNSHKKWSINYEGPLPGINFNTVQGWNTGAGVNFFKWYDDNRTNWISAHLDATYGIAEDRLRFTGSVTKNFNRTNRLRLSIAGGSSVSQFNTSEPISPMINTISSLFFERNYGKFYELNFVRGSYSQELFNGLRVAVTSGYEDRKPLFNTTHYVTLPNDDVDYTSNNPLDPTNFNAAAIDQHTIFKTSVTAAIRFDQKYMTYPDGKYNLGSDKYPRLNLTFENGLGASNSKYNYSQVKANIFQKITLGNKGDFRYRLKGGTFFNGNGISFIDYQHFNGNQTRVGTASNYTNVFNLLPYYDLSTNKSYAEAHVEHDFRGWILGKIPGINKLNFNLVAGAHALTIDGNKPYTEISIGIDNLGIGSFRFLRLDYVKSFYNGNSKGAFVFGLKFLNFID